MSPVLMDNTFVRPHINLGYNNDLIDSAKSLPELIDFASAHNPDHIFGRQARKTNDGMSWSDITFHQFQQVVNLASGWLIRSGTTAGRTSRVEDIAPVALFFSSDITLFMYLAALLRIGTPVLLLSFRLSPASVAYLLRQTLTSVVLTGPHLSRTSDAVRAILADHLDVSIIVAPTFFDFDQDPLFQCFDIPPPYRGHQCSDLDALILHTSGTTGLPKLIYHSQAYVLLYATCHRLPTQNEPFRFNVSTLPLYHGFGFLAPCLSLSIGMPFVLLPSGSIPTAKSTLGALRETGAKYLLTVPSIIEDILHYFGNEGLETLLQLDILVIGGAQVKAAVVQELAKARINFLNHWGVTELGPLAPIELPPPGYDSRYITLRTDTDLKYVRPDDGSGTLRLAGRAPGWSDSFVVQDLLVASPHDEWQVRILGRVDDLLVLANGEKVQPTALEREVASHPLVNDALAFGNGKFQLGLIIELKTGSIDSSVNLSVTEQKVSVIGGLNLGAVLQRGNNFVESHGRVAEEMIIITREDVKPLKRTDKGSVAKKQNYEFFSEEIKKCYETSEVLMSPLPMPDVEAGMALRHTVRKLVQELGVRLAEKFPDFSDFFEAGMDSLQATRLRNSISNRLRAIPNVMDNLPNDLVFTNSSVEKLFLALSSILTGSLAINSRKPSAKKEQGRIVAMNAMVETYKRVFETLRYEPLNTMLRSKSARASRRAKKVLLTGSTGSLGCFLLARLAKDPAVDKVVCLNRSSSISLQARQKDQMNKRGIQLSGRDWAKIAFFECNLNGEDLSLSSEAAGRLLDVTHVIHNAWPINFGWTLASFEPHIRTLVNLVRVAWRGAQGRRGPPVKFMFVSSIAVVGKHPLLTASGSSLIIPECAVDPGSTVEMGYAEAKWVCESLVAVATKLFPGSVRGCSVRVGQMTGSEGFGVWNEKEHFPFLIRISRELKALPLLEGSLSWLPANRVASSVVELLFSQRFHAVYHVENPSRQSSSDVMQMVAAILHESSGRPQQALIFYSDWLTRLRGLANETKNVAPPLLTFFENDFLRLATGGIVLDTTHAVKDSKTMKSSGPLERKHLEQYVRYWKSVDAL